MSEERLDEALEALRNEEINSEELAKAKDRVWNKLSNPHATLCSEFQSQLNDYLNGQMASGKKLLLEDHLGRCPACRSKLAEKKGESNTIPFPGRRKSWAPAKYAKWAIAAALALMVLYATRDRIFEFASPNSGRATVASLEGSLYVLPNGALKIGSIINKGDVVRCSTGSRAVLRLSDGSLADLNENTELSIDSAWSGQTIQLQRGDIIVRAAKQHHGELRVQTRDSIASVKGTIFAVSAGLQGTLVSVIEGKVAVKQPNAEVTLGPGEQSSSNPIMSGSIENAVAWSPDAKTYHDLLVSLGRIAQAVASIPAPTLAAHSNLLGYAPPHMLVYAAAPNLSGTIKETIAMADRQSAENAVFSKWWGSGASSGLKMLLAKIQTISASLGDEIAYGMCFKSTKLQSSGVPMFLAEVQQGKRAALESILAGLGGTKSPFHYHLTDALLAISDSEANLQWLVDNLGQGANTPFVEAIAAHYKQGSSLLFGVDLETIISRSTATADAKVQAQAAGAQQIKHFFIQQRNYQGSQENEATFTFKGPRTGLASLLASSGSGGAAEYISPEAILVGYASTRQPQEIFRELFMLISKASPIFPAELAKSEAVLGFSLGDDMAGALGSEIAFSVDGLSASGLSWIATMQVNNEAKLQVLIDRTVEHINAESAKNGSNQRLIVSEEMIDGRKWHSVKMQTSLLSITWTYDRGYLVAGSDRGMVSKAIAVRNGGSPLIWSAAFQQQFPGSASLHSSAFLWLNTKGAFRGLESLMPNDALRKLISERDPILVVFDGSDEQIRAVSRSRISSVLMNAILLNGVSAKPK